MASSPDNNLSNVFQVGAYSQIRYCVYVDPLSRPLKILLAEWSLRQRSRSSLVACHNKQLWTFALSGDTSPAIPSSSCDLKEISSGTFLTSSLAISNSGSPQEFPQAYFPFLLAFSKRLSLNLTTDYDYVPLGSVLLSANHQLLRFTLRLLSSGLLLLLPNCQRTPLARVSGDAVLPVGEKLMLAPNGIHGTFAEKATEAPRDASTIITNIYNSSGYRVQNLDSWLVVQLDGGMATCLWPSELCFYLPPYEPSTDATKINWFSLQDPIEEAEEFALAFPRKDLSAGSSPGAFKDSGNNSSKRNPITVYPTPPDPAHSHGQAHVTNAVDPHWEAEKNDGDYDLAPKWDGMDGTGASLSHLGPEVDDNAILGDTEEVTEADFNFFDDDHGSNLFGESDNELEGNDEDFLKSSIDTFAAENAPESVPMSSSFGIVPDTETPARFSGSTSRSQDKRIMTPPLSPLTVNQENLIAPTSKKRKSIFSPIAFHPNLESALDNKYSVGGRFYVPPDHSDASESEDDSDEEHEHGPNYLDAKTPYSEGRPDDGRPDARRFKDDDSFEDISSDVYVSRQIWWTLLDDSSLAKVQHLISSTHRSVQNMNRSLLERYTDKSTSAVERSLQALCELVVWDFSLFDSATPPLSLSEPHESDLVNAFNSIFGQIKPISLKEFALVIDTAQSSHEMFTDFNGNLVDSMQVAQSFDGFNVPDLNQSGMLSLLSPSPDEPAVVPKPTKPVFYITPPHYSFMRSNYVLEALPPALRFWQTFSFGPQNGKKDIRCYIIYPSSPGATSAAAEFLERLKPVYEGSGLGNVSLEDAGPYRGGLVPVQSPVSTPEGALESIRKTCASLGRMLLNVNDRNIVVFIATPFTDLISLGHLSQSIYHLKEGFTQSGEFVHAADAHLIPQLIPTQFFAAKDTIVVPSQFDMVKFALMLYNKCVPEDVNADAGSIYQHHFPAYTLARTRPTKIEFKITPNPSPALFAENSFIHVAYAWSKDSGFVTAAWADQYGELARVKPFSLFRNDGLRTRSYQDIFREVWDMTLNIMPKLAINWRLVVAKVGSMGQDELDAWLNLASRTSKNIRSTFVSIDLDPALSVMEAVEQTMGDHDKGAGSSLDTSVRSNDGPSEYDHPPGSADPGNNLTAPITAGQGFAGEAKSGTGGGIDQDSILVDLKDETYGVIINHKLPLDKFDPTCVRFSLASGFLVKPGLSGVMMSVIEVSLVNCPYPWDPFLEDLLKQYRGLASFGAMSGISDGRNGIVPWHIAAVEKMQRALEFLL